MLIDFSIKTSMITHNHPYGFLGGLVSALFTAYAIEGIKIEKWPFLMIDVLNSPKVKSYINRDDDDVYFAYKKYVRCWITYLEQRFQDNKK